MPVTYVKPILMQRLEDTERRLQLWQDTARSFMQDAEFWRVRAEAFQAYVCKNGWDLPDFAVATNPEPPYTAVEQSLQELTPRASQETPDTAGKPW
jgi:hypothetical protein